MPQPKSSRSSGARKPAARKTAARKPAARKPAAKAATKTTARKTATRKPAARKPAAKKTAAKKTAAASRRAARPDEALRANLSRIRSVLSRGVVLSRERVQAAVDDSVKGGQMTRKAAEDLVQNILSAGRQQTQDVLSDVEQMLGRARPDAAQARKRATDAGDAALKQVDKARRVAGIGSFPVLNYDHLTAQQIADRVADLTAAQLRKIRDYERRNANRKSVLNAIERKLG